MRAHLAAVRRRLALLRTPTPVLPRPRASAQRSARSFVALVLLAGVAACDTSAPRVATTLDSVGSRAVAGDANATVAVPPSVTLTDQRGRGLSGVLVQWTVTAGSGTVVNDTIRTDASGSASSGGWQLGTLAGPQSLTATVEGLDPVVFLATVSPGPPAVMQAVVPLVQPTMVNQLVAQPPALTLRDAFGNLIVGATVTFAVSAGGGTILGDVTQVTDANGAVALDGWRIGTRTDLAQRVSASAGQIPTPLVFSATALSAAAVSLEAASVPEQDGVPGLGVTQRPAVRARDQFGNPASGATVVFTPRPSSGTVTGSTRVTEAPDGIARVGNWVLGEADQQSLVARSPQFPADSFVFVANAVESVFFLETAFLNGEPSARNLQAVERAIERWRNVIAGQLEPAQVIANAGECGPGVPAIDEVITNVRLYINFDSIDGPGTVLGRAGPCIIRTASGLPVVGFVELDTADLANLSVNGTLDDVMTHEFGHVLGLQGFSWDRRGLVVGLQSGDPFYQGAVGRAQFASVGGGTYSGTPVPLENTGGAGTRDSHWRISVLRRELMVGFAQAGGMPLSRLSVGSLADLGYQVRLDNAEPFVVPPFGTAAFGALTMPGSGTTVAYGNDEWPSAIWSVDRAGKRQLVRAGDWRVTRRGDGRGTGRNDGR